MILLLVGAIDDDALRADADVGAEGGAKRRRGAAEFEGNLYFFEHAQAETAILSWNRQTEQAQGAHLLKNVHRDLVCFSDLLLQRHQTLADEAPHGVTQLFEGFGIETHVRIPGCGSVRGQCVRWGPS